MGADVTLNSYGGLYADSQSLQAAIAAAEAAGQLFVTAAGNDYGVLHMPPLPSACTRLRGPLIGKECMPAALKGHGLELACSIQGLIYISSDRAMATCLGQQ